MCVCVFFFSTPAVTYIHEWPRTNRLWDRSLQMAFLSTFSLFTLILFCFAIAFLREEVCVNKRNNN